MATAALNVRGAVQKGFEVCFSLLACFRWGVSGEELECRFIILKTVGYIWYILERGNHEVAEVGRDLGRSSGPTPCSGKATCRWLLDVSKDGHSAAPQGNLCQCSVNLTVDVDVDTQHSVLGLYPKPLVLTLDTTDHLPAIFHQVFIYTDKILHDFSLFRLANLMINIFKQSSNMQKNSMENPLKNK